MASIWTRVRWGLRKQHKLCHYVFGNVIMHGPAQQIYGANAAGCLIHIFPRNKSRELSQSHSGEFPLLFNDTSSQPHLLIKEETTGFSHTNAPVEHQNLWNKGKEKAMSVQWVIAIDTTMHQAYCHAWSARACLPNPLLWHRTPDPFFVQDG